MTKAQPLGLILAGGLARRMGGGDKTLVEINGKPILNRVLERMSTQCARVVLNANGDPSRFASYGLPVIPDDVADFPGPLAGILAGMEWAAEHMPDTADIVSVPGDSPFLPFDLVDRLEEVRTQSGKSIACAMSGDWRYPVVALWPVKLRHDLRDAITKEGLRKVEVWMARHGIALAEWPDEPVDPFMNVNTPDDVALAQSISTQHSI